MAGRGRENAWGRTATASALATAVPDQRARCTSAQYPIPRSRCDDGRDGRDDALRRLDEGQPTELEVALQQGAWDGAERRDQERRRS